MIDWNKTEIETGFNKEYFFKYPKSNKLVYRICDICNKEDWVKLDNYNRQKNKNLCNSCSKSNKLNYNYNKLMTNNQKEKIRKSKIGKCSGNKNPMFGKHQSIETKIKNSCSQRNIPIEDFDGFKNRNHVLPESQCIKLNKKFLNSNAHHLTKSIIIYIPIELHRHIRHSLKSGIGMGLMNMLALQFINGEL